MKIFLDDIRNPPDDTWILVRTPADAVYLARNLKFEDTLSLDHDLGDNQPTGYDVITQLEKEYFLGHIWNRGAPTIVVHSQNPVGESNILAAIKNIREKCVTGGCFNKGYVPGTFCHDCTFD